VNRVTTKNLSLEANLITLDYGQMYDVMKDARVDLQSPKNIQEGGLSALHEPRLSI
jgi:hypothetical protein